MMLTILIVLGLAWSYWWVGSKFVWWVHTQQFKDSQNSILMVSEYQPGRGVVKVVDPPLTIYTTVIWPILGFVLLVYSIFFYLGKGFNFLHKLVKGREDGDTFSERIRNRHDKLAEKTYYDNLNKANGKR